MDWPPGAILSGEKFDVSLLDSEEQPVVTIETKEPGHVTSEAENRAFLGRLKRYASLRHAYLTNGERWERYDLLLPLPPGEEITTDYFEDVGRGPGGVLFADLAARQKIGRHFELVLHKASNAELTDFFSPLEASRYHDLSQPLPPGLYRHKLKKDKPEILEDFGAGLRDRISEFRELLNELFPRFRSGDLGTEAASVSRLSFQLWCERSYVIPPDSVMRRMGTEAEKRETSIDDLLAVLNREFGFAAETSESVAELFLAESRKKKSTRERQFEILWPLYSEAIDHYATQTAHVCVARLLLYRIGEDKGLFEQRVSGEPLQELLAPHDGGRAVIMHSQLRMLPELEAIRAAMADFAPTVYESGEFDWWRIVHPEVLTDAQRERLQPIEELLALSFQRLLRRLDRYELSDLDLDVWRDIYQHYLPEEERQRLGGFYTPQELVDLTLDYAGYSPAVSRLCEKCLIDLASGSGAFVISAVARLLAHLSDKDLVCHRSLYARDLTDWERADNTLNIVVRNIHAIDLHPFAAFLTYVNFLFVVLPLYAQVQRQRKTLRLEVSVFAANSLLTPGENAGQRELELAVNSRIQLGRHAQERYREIRDKKFDVVVGNPPWGGILKGRLAPIFDENYKRQLEAEYRDTYSGKLDIYGLFYDRALRWLKAGGTVALVTQGSFIDKEWAGPHIEFGREGRIETIGLRRKLAEHASLHYLIDLNPFGQLFFGAMNIPCIAVFEKRPSRAAENAIVLLSSKKLWPRGSKQADRRREVVQTVRRCLELVASTGEPLKQDFVTAFAFPLERLREFRGGRWLLAPKEFTIRSRPGWPQLAQLLEPFQGVTVGGEGGLSIFLMPEARARQLRLEKALIHRIIKGHETRRWRVDWQENVILYPYVSDKKDKWRPAFACHHPPVLDALDFEHCSDKFEQEWVRKYGRHPNGLKRVLEHRRDALKLVQYPQTAEYLLQYYEQLSGRTFKKRNVLDFGRQWYEFIWPRDASIIFGQPKIISPRLTPRVRFALDQEGIGIQDSCICLAVSENTKAAFDEFRRHLSKLAGRDVRPISVYRYLLGILNSSYAQDLLTTGRRPTPKGHFQIDEQFLNELSVPICATKRQLREFLESVDACMLARTEKALAPAEARLNPLVLSLYSQK